MFGEVGAVAEVEADVGNGIFTEEDQVVRLCVPSVFAAIEWCPLELVVGVAGHGDAEQPHHAED